MQVQRPGTLYTYSIYCEPIALIFCTLIESWMAKRTMFLVREQMGTGLKHTETVWLKPEGAFKYQLLGQRSSSLDCIA